jgi:hypothetical protein
MVIYNRQWLLISLEKRRRHGLNGGQRSSMRHHLSINFINGVFEVQVLLLLLQRLRSCRLPAVEPAPHCCQRGLGAGALLPNKLPDGAGAGSDPNRPPADGAGVEEDPKSEQSSQWSPPALELSTIMNVIGSRYGR